LFAPLLGALVIKALGEATKLLSGDAPGLDLVIYGLVLIAVVGLAPRGVAGVLTALLRPLRVLAGPERGNV
jgi:branched-chain amino acid transport system permease protein